MRARASCNLAMSRGARDFVSGHQLRCGILGHYFAIMQHAQLARQFQQFTWLKQVRRVLRAARQFGLRQGVGFIDEESAWPQRLYDLRKNISLQVEEAHYHSERCS